MISLRTLPANVLVLDTASNTRSDEKYSLYIENVSPRSSACVLLANLKSLPV